MAYNSVLRGLVFMTSDTAVLIGQMKIIASLIAIGIFEQRSGLFDDKLINAFSAITSKLILPVMLITLIGSVSRAELIGSWKFFLCSVGFYAITVSVSRLISNLPAIPSGQKGMHTLIMSFGNAGFIGVPLIVSVFGDSAGTAAAAFSFVEATLCWVAGPLIVAGGGRVDLKKLVSPITASILIGAAIVLLNMNFSGNVLWDTMKDVGGTCKYFASIYIGMNIGRMGIKKLGGNLRVFAAAPFKLLVFPVAAYLLFGKTGILTGDTLTMFIVLFATPSGMVLPIVAEMSGLNGEYVSAGCMASTILCLFTIPFVIWLTGII